jgi:glycosyltransferase involved in cell wall biosynthesis
MGGGWSFARNFVKCFGQTPYEQAEIYFIPSPSMVQRDEVEQAKTDGKKIVLRLDNVLRNSRNRNTGMSRMKSIAEMADLLIYQSQWAKDFLMPYLKKDGLVILNSVDESIFYPPATQRIDYANTYLYSRFNRDEGKNWQSAWYYFYFLNAENPNVKLNIVGQFSTELREYNFDFYNGEQFKYWGAVDEKLMADLYRNSRNFIYTYSFDACSNSLIEALMSGCKIVGDNYYKSSGGAKEIIYNFREYGREYFGLDRMKKEYEEALETL